MKVGTDGTTLGVWAQVPAVSSIRILDIGTGTGLIALIMAQRFPGAKITAIDIDESAITQSRKNIGDSPFADCIDVVFTPLQEFDGSHFDAIVCNPPYFENSLVCPNGSRTTARHTTQLTYHELMEHAYRMLDDGGEFSVVIPGDCKDRLNEEAFLAGFFIKRICALKTTPAKHPKRYLIAYTKKPAQTENSELVIGSDEYKELTKDFYL